MDEQQYPDEYNASKDKLDPSKDVLYYAPLPPLEKEPKRKSKPKGFRRLLPWNWGK